MLDSYTQTNEDDRLSTKLITCWRMKVDAQTDPLPSENFRLASKSARKVSLSMQTVDPVSVTVESTENIGFDINTPISFELKRTCRHGNERTICSQCNNSVVHRKHKTPIPPNPTEHARQSRVGTKPPVRQDDGTDSGQESDIEPPPVVSNAKLARIRHLARAKLRQIRQPPDRSTRSVERPLLHAFPEEEEYEPALPTKTHSHRRKPKVYDGVESLTLQDLPALVDRNPKGYIVDVRTNEISRHKEDLRQSDVARARRYIRNSIDNPVESVDSYKHKTRSRGRDSGISSLPQIDESRRCESEATNKRGRSIADDVESRKCVSEVPSGRMRSFDVNYKAYVNALERIVDSNLSSLARADRYYNNK